VPAVTTAAPGGLEQHRGVSESAKPDTLEQLGLAAPKSLCCGGLGAAVVPGQTCTPGFLHCFQPFFKGAACTKQMHLEVFTDLKPKLAAGFLACL